MPKTHIARKIAHTLAVVEDLGRQAVAFALEELATL